MLPDPMAFRRTMGYFVTGVSVITTLDGERPWGTTVNAFNSVSLEPPLVMVALDRKRSISPIIRSTRRYAVNVLGEDQQALSDCFAGAPARPDRDHFCGADWRPGVTGQPLLAGAIATFECSVVDIQPAGDHELFIGKVENLDAREGSAMPLLYFRRRYLRIEKAEALELEVKEG